MASISKTKLPITAVDSLPCEIIEEHEVKYTIIYISLHESVEWKRLHVRDT